MGRKPALEQRRTFSIYLSLKERLILEEEAAAIGLTSSPLIRYWIHRLPRYPQAPPPPGTPGTGEAAT